MRVRKVNVQKQIVAGKSARNIERITNFYPKKTSYPKQMKQQMNY